MKRALLVTAGTVAGLASVLSYSPPGATQALAAVDAGSASGLGGPRAPAGAVAKVPPAKPPAKAAAKAVAKPAAPANPAAAARPVTAAPRAALPKAPAVKKAVAPVAKKVVKPVATKTPVVSIPKDFVGAPVTYKYGTMQVGIRVSGGKVVDAWAVQYPVGPSLPYSEMAIPILRSQTIAASSAQIAGATGASLTSASWESSLASALSKAGI